MTRNALLLREILTPPWNEEDVYTIWISDHHRYIIPYGDRL